MRFKPSHKTITPHRADHDIQHHTGRGLCNAVTIILLVLANYVLTTRLRSTSTSPTNKPYSESDVPIPRHETLWEKVKHIIPFTNKGGKDGESGGGKAKVQ